MDREQPPRHRQPSFEGKRRARRHRDRVGVLALTTLLGFTGAVGPARAQEPPSTGELMAFAGDGPILVGTKEAPPFAFRDAAGDWRGISIDLWRGIAEDLGLDYELRELPLSEIVAGVESGSLTAGVAALTITAERERTLDFSHPFFTSGLGIAVVAENAGWWEALGGLASRRFLQLVLALTLVLLLAGALVWFFERRRNADHFGGGVLRGLGNAFWWSAVTMTTVGYGDKAPATLGGRLVALVWMFASVIMISSFTAAIASSLTVGQLGSRIRGPEDLGRVRVATVAATTSEDYLRSERIACRAVSSVDEALELLASDQVDAVVYDAPILLHRAHGGTAEGFTVLPGTFVRQDYGFAFPQGHPLREAVNRSLLRRLREPGWQNTLFDYLGASTEGG